MTKCELKLAIPSTDIIHDGYCGGFTHINTNVNDALNNFDRITDMLHYRIADLEKSSKDDGSTAINEFNSNEIKHTDLGDNETNVKDELDKLQYDIISLKAEIRNNKTSSHITGYPFTCTDTKNYITIYPYKIKSTGDNDKDLAKLISLRYDIDNYLALKIKLHSGTTQTCIISEKFGSKIHKVLNDEFGRPLTAEGVTSRASIVDNFRQRCKFLER